MNKLILPGHINPASDEKEQTFELTGADLERIISNISERFKEIISRAENVANADDDNLMPAVEALRETFNDMPRDDLQAMAEDMH